MKNIKLYPELEKINNSIFKLCGFEISNLIHEAESQEYHACDFQLNGSLIKFRKAKVTPKKVGQFVALWKRSESGVTEPFNILDNFEYYIIATQTDINSGFFIFPKAILEENKILTSLNYVGKRSFRLYPPWDISLNLQAKKTQLWQKNYFIELSTNLEIDFEKVKKIIMK